MEVEVDGDRGSSMSLSVDGVDIVERIEDRG